MYASRTREEEFAGHDENCQQNASDLEGSLVTSSRPPGRPQKWPDDQTSNGGVAAQAADGSRRTVGHSLPYYLTQDEQLQCCLQTAELHQNELWKFFLCVRVLVWFGSSQNLGSVHSAHLSYVRFPFLFTVHKF